MDSDLLVVGAGPCGLSAAISAAKNGYTVTCIDRKLSPGVPVKCAEGIAEYLLQYLPFKLPKSVFKLRIKGIHFWHDDYDITKRGKFYRGRTIDRVELEKWLYSKASDAGANVYYGCEAKSISLKQGRFDYIETKSENAVKNSIRSKKLLICDGADSTLLRMMGLQYGKTDLINVYSWSMGQINLTEPELEQVIFSKNLANGYGYIFPKANNEANVGVGAAYLSMNDLKKKFNNMIKTNRFFSQFNNAKFLSERSKAARFWSGSNNLHFNNIAVCGDAANINYKPLIEGILPAIISGSAAGEYLSENGKILLSYDKYIESKLPQWDDNLVLNRAMKELFESAYESSLPLFALCSGLIPPTNLTNFYKMAPNKQKEICRRDH